MDIIYEECQKINQVFESIYIYKSIVVCNEQKHFYYIPRILKKLLFPVEVITHDTLNSTFKKFQEGKIRMLVVSELMLNILLAYYPYDMDTVDVVFLSKNVILSTETMNNMCNKNIFSLSI